MERLPVSLLMVSWNSGSTLRQTLRSYQRSNLLNFVKESLIFIQENSRSDIRAATAAGLEYFTCPDNIGIGSALRLLLERSTQPYVLFLEHDWKMVVDEDSAYMHMHEAVEMLSERSIDLVRLRHRTNPGFPLHSQRLYEGQELRVFDPTSQSWYPHLLGCVHWVDDPVKAFPQHIHRVGSFFVASAEHANWTNNPFITRREVVSKTLDAIPRGNSEIETDVAHWWTQQPWQVGHGQGLFTHSDLRPKKSRLRYIISRAARTLTLGTTR
mgnify:CR=1 FL=1